MQQSTLTVSCADKTHHFSLAEVVRLEACSNYTIIHSLNQRPLTVAKVLRAYELMLEQTGFIRTHRRHLINAQHITAAEGVAYLRLRDESKVAVSRRKRKAVFAQVFST